VFHPKSCETLLTVGDDRKVKIWRSKRLVRELGIEPRQGEGASCHDDDFDMDSYLSDDSTTTCCGMKKKNKEN